MIPAPSKIVESYKIFNIEQKYLPATCPGNLSKRHKSAWQESKTPAMPMLFKADITLIY